MKFSLLVCKMYKKWEGVLLACIRCSKRCIENELQQLVCCWILYVQRNQVKMLFTCSHLSYVEYLHITLVNCFPRKWITRRRGIWGVQKINKSFTIIFLQLKACCWASCFFTNFSFIHASRSVWSLEYKLNSFVVLKYFEWSYSLTRTLFLVRGVVTWKF